MKRSGNDEGKGEEAKRQAVVGPGSMGNAGRKGSSAGLTHSGDENRVSKPSSTAPSSSSPPTPTVHRKASLATEGGQDEDEDDDNTVTTCTEGDSDNDGDDPDGEAKERRKKEAGGGINPEAHTKAATERLLKELKELRNPGVANDGYSVTPVEDNFYKWHVKLFGWDADAQIKEDLALYESVTGRDHVLLEVIFPKEYPSLPPFIRVVYPRFHQYTGHTTIGGSICVKDLTRSGWSSEFQLRPFFVMIRNLLLEGGALVDMDNAGIDYSEEEAREAFDRVARAHGWEP